MCPHCGREHAATTCPDTGQSVDEPGPCGTRIDRYEILERIGGGGFGSVYRARHVHTLREVALKLMGRESTADVTTLTRFKHEAQIATAISSPHVVEILDWGVLPSGEAFLVMELLDGQDLAALLRAGRLPVPRAVEIATELLQALAAVHAAGAIHRDVKPSNVILAHEGSGGREVTKLVDFGCVRTDRRPGDTLTRSGTTIGTPRYMAPEQLRGSRLDARTDLYAVAVVLYEMVAGQLPPDDEPRAAHVAAVTGLPAYVADAIVRGLAPEPAKRWDSAEAFALALADPAPRPAREASLAPTVPDHPARPRARAGRSRALVLAGVGVAAVVAVSAVVLASRDSNEPAPVAPPTAIRGDAGSMADATLAIGTEPALSQHPCTSSGHCPSYRCRCASESLNGGRCGDEGRCLAAPSVCPDLCRASGGWSGTYEIAEPQNAEDCAASPQCTTRGQCGYRRDTAGMAFCVKSCQELHACTTQGRCTDEPGSDRCIAGADADCAGSEACRDSGLCTAQNGECAATRDTDCAATTACAQYGLCRAIGGTCSARTVDDCAAACKYNGRCALKKNWCVVTAQGCARSEVCQTKQWCRVVDGECGLAP